MTFSSAPTPSRCLHRVAFIAAAGLSLAFLAALPANAQSGTFGGYTFSLTNSAEDWNLAEAEAVADGGHLASVTSQAEEDFLINTFLTNSSGQGIQHTFWLGGTDVVNGAVTANYSWTDGSQFNYTDWKSGEPNDSGGNEHYIATNWDYSRNTAAPIGTWNDTPLDGTRGYGGNTDGPYFGLIETPAAVPEASTTVSFGLLLALGGAAIVAKRKKVSAS